MEKSGEPMKKVYLAGPMSGYPDFNFPAFHLAAAKLRAEGLEVCNPAEKDLEDHDASIFKGSGDVEACEAKGFSLRDALKFDLSWICDNADGIVMLPGWEHSSGARTEWSLANCLRIPVRYLTKEELA